MSIEHKIASEIGVSHDAILDAIKMARSKVVMFTIPKRNKKPRVIYHPSKKTKMVQYWIMYNILSLMPVHQAASAYVKNKSILDNALEHRNGKYFLKIDFKDFFPSIKFEDFLTRLISKAHQDNIQWLLDKDLHEIIRKVCFYHQDILAIGYPTSPVISNIVMYELDKLIAEKVENEDQFGRVVYTRYADDLVFSTNKKGACSLIFTEIKNLLSTQKSPSLSINLTKLNFSSSTGGSATVTGLRVCSGGVVKIHRKQKDHVRLLLSLLKKGKLTSVDDKKSLMGHLSYIKHVDAAFYTKMQHKFFREIYELRRELKSDNS